jgi:hypothetical protein
MRKGRSYASKGPRQKSARKPAGAADGALYVREYMLKLFDREEGKAADWPLIAETLLIASFAALDEAPHDPRVLILLKRTSEGSYSRQTQNWAETLDLVQNRPTAPVNTFNAAAPQPGPDEAPKSPFG